MDTTFIRCPSCREPLDPDALGTTSATRCPSCGQAIGPVSSRRALLRDTGKLALLLAAAPALLESCASASTSASSPAQAVGMHDWNQADFTTKSNTLGGQGWRLITLSMYGDPADPRFAAVFVQGGPAWYAIYNYTFADAQTTFNQQVAKGFYPTIMSANGAGDAARVSLVFEQHTGPVPLTRWGMPWGDVSNPNTGSPTTFMDYDAVARGQNLWLVSVTTYGDANNRLYGVIWAPDPAGALWCCDSAGEPIAALTQRIGSQSQQLARPAYITLSADQQYVAAFRNDLLPAPAAVVDTDLTHDGYQARFDSLVAQGFIPVCLQGGGTGAQTRFAAIFVKKNTPEQRVWTATGYPSSTAVDGAMKAVMQKSRVRAASLAVVNNTKLVLARGYTWAESDYPVTQPTTYFRLASCSKTITALAIEQLYSSRALTLGQSIQQILQLTTPQGSAPSSAFSAITVQDLLEMRSGLENEYAGNYLPIAQAFGTTLPINGVHLASYLAGRPVASQPNYVYNNNGFNLLAYIVAKLRHPEIADPSQGYVQAIMGSIMTPLGITRCRLGRTRREDQQAGEALYDSSWDYFGDSVHRDLFLTPSQVSADQHLVPMQYGGIFDVELSAGGGGLSMAMPDLARVLAALNVTQNNPILDARLIAQFFGRGVAANQHIHGCYGWDAVSAQGSGYVADKGGDFPGAQSGVYFQSGGLCFAVAWNYDNVLGDWYPNFPEVLAHATGSNVSSTDLFPQFGMPSLGS